MGWDLCLAPVSGHEQRFDAMGFRSLASTITLSVTCHRLGRMTGSVFPTRRLLGKVCQGHQDRWQLQGEKRGVWSQTRGSMPVMQLIQSCAARQRWLVSSGAGLEKSVLVWV